MSNVNWLNSDGLYIKYGQNEGNPGIAGEYRTNAQSRVTEVILDLTTLTTSDTILDYNATLPKNARFEKVEIETLVAVTSGGSSTLDIGTIKSDQTTTSSATGWVAALAKATFAAVGTITTLTVGVTSAGAQLGTTPGFQLTLTGKANTAVFTAGKVAIRLFWSTES
jgi:hypothetical protein